MRLTAKAAKRTCARKIPYPTRATAEAAARAMHQRDGGRMRAYRCSVGAHGERRHWHVGRLQ